MIITRTYTKCPIHIYKLYFIKWQKIHFVFVSNIIRYKNLPKINKPLAIQIKEHLYELNISTDNIQAEEFKNIA